MLINTKSISHVCSLLSSLSLTIAQFEIDYDVAMEENEEMRSRCVALIGREEKIRCNAVVHC